MRKIKSEDISELMRIFSIVAGIIVGIGFVFIGLINKTFWITLLGFIALLTGLITSPTLLNETDEYESTIKNENTKKSL